MAVRENLHPPPGVAPVLVIVALWACAVLPGLSLRSFIWEEGTNAEIARDILMRWDVLEPAVYGIRWSEHPSLLPLLIAGVATITGAVNEWSARLPAMISVLLTAMLVLSLARRYMSTNAAVFSSLAFLFCPMLLQKLTIAEPDTVVTLLSFAAFVVWWNGAAAGRVSLPRWVGCGAILAVMTLAKGPQPVGYFALGVGSYLALERRWLDLAGLVVCLALPSLTILAWATAVHRPGDAAQWLYYMRLGRWPAWSDYLMPNIRNIGIIIVELLPAVLLLPFVPWPWSRESAGGVPKIVAPLLLYASMGTAVLILWPGANSRYAMPIAPAVAVLAGFAWESLERTAWHRLRAFCTGLLGCLIVYRIVLVTVAMPLFADRFGESRREGKAIEAAILARPAPTYCALPYTNRLFYVRVPFRYAGFDELASMTPPLWLIAPSAALPSFAKLRPDVEAQIIVETKAGVALVDMRAQAR